MKKTIILTLMTIALFISVLITLTTPKTENDAAPAISIIKNDNRPVIVIDPGHGGMDGGASGYDGIAEKTYNLSFSKKLQFFFETSGYKTVMTRENDDDTDKKDGFYKKSDLDNRIKIANENPNSIFVSIHLNISNSPNDKGFQVFYGTANEKSKELANALKLEMEKSDICNRVREVSKTPNSVYIQKHITCPSVLIESGFMSNSEDYNLLKNDKYQEKLMFAVFSAVHIFYNKNNLP